jgi:REP element-mobilizing transposase RayT
MNIQPYRAEELSFAWCSRMYFRWRTHRRKPISVLSDLSEQEFRDLIQPYDIHLLELAKDPIELRALVSLLPSESAASAASKLKGRVSKWLSDHLYESNPKHLARGYFAVTTGASTADVIDAYLENQGDHHGYLDRALPPIFVQSYAPTPETDSLLRADHSTTRLRFQFVLATWQRNGVFVSQSAETVSDKWLQLQKDIRFRIDKVSFVPDHVHIAVTLHPAVSPDSVVLALMNASQDLMVRQFELDVIRANVERLWQPSAYIGSFGDLTSNAISGYIRNWEASCS